ncbi:MAG: flagellar biosynthesis anti-sigma factor FlgM [Sphingomonas bacterium]
MVDSIGAKPVTTGDLAIPAVTRVAAAGAVSSTPEQAGTVSAQPQTLAAQLASAPPVDTDRVQRIKDALANGTFPISPATIADQLIALRYDWLSHDKT